MKVGIFEEPYYVQKKLLIAKIPYFKALLDGKFKGVEATQGSVKSSSFPKKTIHQLMVVGGALGDTQLASRHRRSIPGSPRIYLFKFLSTHLPLTPQARLQRPLLLPCSSVCTCRAAVLRRLEECSLEKDVCESGRSVHQSDFSGDVDMTNFLFCFIERNRDDISNNVQR